MPFAEILGFNFWRWTLLFLGLICLRQEERVRISRKEFI